LVQLMSSFVQACVAGPADRAAVRALFIAAEAWERRRFAVRGCCLGMMALSGVVVRGAQRDCEVEGGWVRWGWWVCDVASWADVAQWLTRTPGS